MIVGAGEPLAVAANDTVAPHCPAALFTVRLPGELMEGAGFTVNDAIVAAVLYGYILDVYSRNAIPIDPTAERTVEWHAIEQNECATRATRTHASERNTLSGGVSGQSTRAPEQREAWNLPEYVVDRERSRGTNFVQANIELADRRRWYALFVRDRRADDDAFVYHRRIQAYA